MNYNQRKFFDVITILYSKYGFWRSLSEGKPCDSEGNDLPWYTYPAIEYIKNLELKDKEVFEWGSGSSSIFWSTRAKSVISIEHNPDWYKKISRQRRSNMKIYLKENKFEYIKSIGLTGKKFDIIVIDGEYRTDCCKLTLKKYLKKHGIIILDNSDWFPISRKLLISQGLLEVAFSGFSPLNNYTLTTSFFFSDIKGIKTKESINSIASIIAYEDNK